MQPLGSLTRGAQLRRLRRVLPEVYASYGLIQPTARLLRYEDNAVYVIVSGDGRRTLRLSIRNGRTTDEQVSELRWMEALLRDSRVRVPCPVPTRFGAPVVDVDSPHLEVAATAVMFEWIPGKIPPRGQMPSLAAKLGTVTAALHDHAAGFAPPEGFTRPSWSPAAVFHHADSATDTLSGPNAAWLTGDSKTLDAVCDATLQAIGTDLDQGLIHADLYRENVIVTPDGGVALIDFDACGWGPFMLDIATMLSSARRAFVEQPAYHRFATSYLKAYREVRPLPGGMRNITAYLVMRDMIIVDFILASDNLTVATWGPARIDGILRRFRDHLDTGRYPGDDLPEGLS